jgi:O-antigen/teichoic acid export membrane protein
MKDLKAKTIRGGFAKVCAQAASFVLRIGSLMALARLLTPQDFGLVGMVTVVTGVFGLFKDAGLSMATVQRATISDEQVSTLFWVNMLVGITLASAAVALAPALVRFYHEPRLFSVTVALATGFVLNAAGVQHSALLQRQMRFAALAAIETVALVVSIVVVLVMAFSGFGYWALVAMPLTLTGGSTLGFWVCARWIPGSPRRGIGVASMMRFGGVVTLNSLVMYAAYNADKILLGRLWGAEVLGIYGRAYQLINIPTENLNSAVGGVAVSALSRLQDDPIRFRAYFLKGYSLVLVLTIPVTIACALFAHEIIWVLLGVKWMAAVTIFRLLAPTILAFAFLNPLAWLLVSTGHIRRSMKMALVIAPLVTASYVAGLPFGTNGVAFGYSAMMAALIVPMILWATRDMPVSSRDILSAVGPPLLSAIVATGVSVAFVYFCAQSLSPLRKLLAESSVLLAAYMVTLLFGLGQWAFYRDLIRQLTRRSDGHTARTLERLQESWAGAADAVVAVDDK